MTTYSYDALNRRTKATYQDGTSTISTYDAGNRITQVQEMDATNTVTATITRIYDGLDRLTEEVTPQGQIDYTYDTASRRTSMTVAGQTAVTYGYDNANRLTTITQGTNTVTIGYDDADRRTSLTLPNGNSLTYTYDAASQLTAITYKQGGTTIGDLAYTYDAAGNRIKVGGAFARVTIPPALTTVSYNANNQQTTFGTNTLTYDLDGNLATVTEAGNTATYTWNARNQLTGISVTGYSASFAYDSFGRRTGKTINGTTTNYVYDGLNPVQEKNGSTVTANLLTGLGIDEFFTRTDAAGSRALLPDALGSTVALGDGAGTLQTQYTYEPFGYATAAGQANSSSYKYTGREDDGSGLFYYRARYYHPRLQRFIAEDPIGFLGGDFNVYGYVRNSPTMLVDPDGLTAETNANFFFDWLFGGGANYRTYGPNSVEIDEMRNSIAAEIMRDQYRQKGCQGLAGFSYGTFQAYWNTLGNPFTADPTSTAFQVGGFAGASVVNNGNGTATFNIKNVAGAHSFFYHAVPNVPWNNGPMRNITQVFSWTEPLSCTCTGNR